MSLRMEKIHNWRKQLTWIFWASGYTVHCVQCVEQHCLVIQCLTVVPLPFMMQTVPRPISSVHLPVLICRTSHLKAKFIHGGELCGMWWNAAGKVWIYDMSIQIQTTRSLCKKFKLNMSSVCIGWVFQSLGGSISVQLSTFESVKLKRTKI